MWRNSRPMICLNAVFDGAIADADDRLHPPARFGPRPVQACSPWRPAMPRASPRLRVDVERNGRTARMAVRQARPPVFFKQQPAMQRQVALWDGATLLQASELLGRATRDPARPASRRSTIRSPIAPSCLWRGWPCSAGTTPATDARSGKVGTGFPSDHGRYIRTIAIQIIGVRMIRMAGALACHGDLTSRLQTSSSCSSVL